jgi:phosphatidylinositol alpha-mannosyltransferase
MRIRIAFFTKELPSDKPNGVSCQVHRLANALVDRGHSCTCISFSPRPEDARYYLERIFYTTSSKILRKLEPARSFRRVDIDRFDIVHYHGDDYLVPGSRRRVRTFYGSALSEAIAAPKLLRKAYQSMFYCFEWVSCIRKGAKAGISKATARALPLVRTVIPCGVPCDTYAVGTKKTDHPSILFLGDLNSRKRGDVLLHLFTNDILKRYPDCTLTVVGPQRCSGRNIIYAGTLSETAVIEKYQESWVYCMPSSYEGFGVPAIEAMACGTAVVAVDNPGVREIIRNKYNGLRVADTHLSAGIRQIIADDALRETFEKNGRTVVEKMFDIRLVAEKYERLYLSLLQ